VVFEMFLFPWSYLFFLILGALILSRKRDHRSQLVRR
jgi:hypothetical protein